jgi:hypothetical protein
LRAQCRQSGAEATVRASPFTVGVESLAVVFLGRAQ